MKLLRRQFLHLVAGAAAVPAVSRIARAQAYPSRPVRLIAPFPPGGSIDLTSRLIGQWLTDRLGQPVVIENRSGAAGNLGSEAALSSPPDGYTLLLCSVANAISATLYDKLNYNFRDVAPVAGISRAPNVMVLHPSVPAETVPEFIAYAKGNPGKINMASSGTGTSIHMSGELFKLPGSTCNTCLIAVRRPCSPTSSPAKSRSPSTTCNHPYRTSRLARCARWR